MILALFIFLPSAFFSIFRSSSLSLGFIATFACFLLITVSSQSKLPRIGAKKLFLLSIIYFILSISLLNLIAFNPNKKSLQILIIFTIMTVVVLLYEKEFITRFATYFKKYSLLLIYFLMCLFFISKYTNDFNFGGKHSIFVFSEPSHYLFSTSCLFFFSFAKGGKYTRIIIYLFYISFIFLQNSLLCLFIIILLTIIANNIYIYIIFGSCFFYIYAFFYDQISYFTERLNFFEISNNLSLLVYQDGLYSAYTSLKNTLLLGYGIGNLGYVNDEISPFRQRINQIYGSKLNNFDGSFLASKIISEFGIIGILIVIFSIFLITLNYFRYHNQKSLYNCFNISVSFSFLIELLIRGSSYFTLNVFLFSITSFYYILSYRSLRFI